MGPTTNETFRRYAASIMKIFCQSSSIDLLQLRHKGMTSSLAANTQLVQETELFTLESLCSNHSFLTTLVDANTNFKETYHKMMPNHLTSCFRHHVSCKIFVKITLLSQLRTLESFK